MHTRQSSVWLMIASNVQKYNCNNTNSMQYAAVTNLRNYTTPDNNESCELCMVKS